MKNQKGQVLLITIMLLATALTIVLSNSFKTTTDTQTTKLQEESQKALAAAESAIEVALRSKSDATIGQGGLVDITGFSGGATISTEANKKTFVTPLLQSDEQYTFYLANTDWSPPSYTNSVTIYYGSTTSNCSNISLEITIIYGALNSIARFIADTGNLLGAGVADDIGITLGSPVTLEGTTFNCGTSAINIGGYADAKLLIVRLLSSPSKIGFDGGSNNLKPQGKTISSEARSVSGVSKKVELFQSYPQIPSDFFVTSF